MALRGTASAPADLVAVQEPEAGFDRVPARGDAAGWYLDPGDPRTRRLWDGAAWATAGGQPVRRPRERSVPLPRRLQARFAAVVSLVLAAVLAPVPLMALTAPAGGSGPMSAWMRSLALATLGGVVLWSGGLALWRATSTAEARQLAASYDAARRWRRTCLTAAVVTAVFGVLGAFLSLFLLALAAAFSTMNAGL